MTARKVLVLLAAGVASCDSTKPANPLTERETVALGDTLTLNGEPNVEYTVEYWLVFDDDFEVVKSELTLVFGGAVTWRRRDGDTDTCSVDLTLESTDFDEYGDVVGDFRGRICDLDLVIDPDELGF